MTSIDLLKRYADRISLNDEDVNYLEGLMKLFALELLREHEKETEYVGDEMCYAERSKEWIKLKAKDLHSHKLL